MTMNPMYPWRNAGKRNWQSSLLGPKPQKNAVPRQLLRIETNSKTRMRKRLGGKGYGRTGHCWLRPRKSTSRKRLKVRVDLPPLQAKSIFCIPDAMKTEAEKREEEDAGLLAAIAARRKLASDLELAKGIQYIEPLKTS